MTSGERSPAQVLAAHLLAELVAFGCRQVFLAPGSRSQSLAIAANQLAEAGQVQLTVRLDERSLGFQALGAAVETGLPSIVIVTSGTAVANLHPAVLEAHHSGVPMILLTADRPHELRGVGANQTTNQVGIFSDAIRGCLDIAAPEANELQELPPFAKQLGLDAWQLATGTHEASELGAGPVQLNLGFREPLSSLEPNAVQVLGELETLPIGAQKASGESVAIDLSIPTVIVAGSQALPHIAELLPGVPVFAEPSSGARHGDGVILHYREMLGRIDELIDQIRQIVVTGKPTLSREVVALLRRPEVRVLVVPSPHGFFDIRGDAEQLGTTNLRVGAAAVPVWLSAFKAADAVIEAEVQPPLASQPVTRRAVIVALYEATQANDRLVLGASRMIRVADFWAPRSEARIWSNRGLAGIDGTIATAVGMANASQSAHSTRLLIGDLTFLHDAGSLALDASEPERNIQVIVVNDRGGNIFESLEVADQVNRKTFDRVFATPQTASIGGLAKAYGWRHISVKTSAELSAAMTLNGRVVIEVEL